MPATTAEKPAVAPVRAARPAPPPPAHLDSPLRTMFGLLVLWGSLGLIFWAHRASDHYFRPDAASGIGPATLAQAGLMPPTLAPLMQTYGANFPKSTPRQAVAEVAASLKLETDQENLNSVLGKQVQTFEFAGIPLFKAIHRLIANREVGYAIQGNSLVLFRQQLQSPPMDRRQINWKATLDLSDKPASIFPSGDSDLWFTIQMIRDLSQSEDPWRTMQVELWKGSERQNTARPTLDDSGKAIIMMSTSENISFQIKRTAAAPGNRAPGRFELLFSFQSFD